MTVKRANYPVYLLLIFVFSTIIGRCQQVYTKTYGQFDFNYGKDVIIDSNGLYILGTTNANSSNTAPMLIRTDTAGLIQKINIESTNQLFSASKFYKKADKLYVCGHTNNIETNDYDCFLNIYDTNLTLLRSVTFGGSSWDFANDINGFDSLLFIVGQSYSTPNGFSWGTISKFNLSGDSLSTFYYGSDGEASISSLIVRGDSELVTTGWLQATDSLFSSTFISSFKTDGAQNWNKNLSADLGKSVGNDIENGFNDRIIICGSSEKHSAETMKDAFIYILEPNGDYHRHQILNEAVNTKDEEFTSLTKTDQGELFVAGITKSFGAGGFDLSIFKLSQTGWWLWSNSYGQAYDDMASSIKYSPSDSGFVLCGTSTYIGNYNNNILILKTTGALTLNYAYTHQLSTESLSQTQNIHVFPNPATEFITFSTEENTPIISVDLFDLQGQLIARSESSSNTATLNTSMLPSQLLIAKVTTKNGIKTIKISKF